MSTFVWSGCRNQAEIVDIHTSDGLRLTGVLYEPQSSESGNHRPVDAFVVTHGSMDSFAGSVMRFVGEGLSQMGYPTLVMNNRGTEIGWQEIEDPAGRAGYFGHGFETVDEALLDLRAGLDWFSGKGYKRLGLAGHSLGGVKILHYLTGEFDERIGAAIALSAPRFSYSAMLASENGPALTENIDRARSFIEQGRGGELMPVTFPMPAGAPTVMLPTTYIDKYGPAARYDPVPRADQIRAPLLYLMGSLETGVVFREFPETLVRLAVNSAGARTIRIDGADHFYRGHEGEALAGINEWLASLP